MSAQSASPASQDLVVIPALRNDLIVTRQIYESRTFYVIKDPVSLQYFRLTAEDYFLATLFDGVRTFGQVRAAYLEHYPQVRLENTAPEINERITRFANDLALMQFLSVQGQRLKQRFEAARKRPKKGLFSTLVTKLFFSRFSVYDPDLLFSRMARPLWWIWTRATLWISIALVILACLVFVRNYGRIAPTMSDFFSLHNLVLVWVVTIIIKSIHELGHGVTCKHFGGEVHEVGVMLLVFTPYFFVNVSDSWVMPNRRHRILISAAGIYVELILAAFATFLWAVVQPGALQQLLFNIMVIASVSTIVFNANPLMRFDGYYILTDLLEVPNLSTKSRAFVSHQVKRLLFGQNFQDATLARMPLPRRRLGLFYFYAVASYLYGYFVIYNLTRYMSARMAPYGLETLGTFLSVSALLAWVVFPIWSFFKGLQLTSADWNPHGRLRRLASLGGGALLAFAVACVFPQRVTIKRAAAVDFVHPEGVRPEVSGFIGEVYVKEGDVLAAGAPVALLRNREVEQRYTATEHKLRIANLMIQRAWGLDHPEELRPAESTKAQFEATFAEAKKDKEQLILRTLTGGVVLTRDLPATRGQLIKSGELFCEVGAPQTMSIRIPLTERQVRYVRRGQPVAMKASAYPRRTLRGRIADDPLMMVGRNMPPGLSETRAGDVPTGVSRDGKEVPLEVTYEARVVVDNSDGSLRQGMTGRAQISAGRQLFGKLVLQSVLDLISLDYRF